MEALARIDAAVRRWNVLEHPFYKRWSAGDLSRAELAEYAAQYRHAVVALADTAAAAGDPRHALEEAAHVSLWDAFAEACGADACDPSSETLECDEAWRAGEDRLENLAVLYAIESAQPAIARTKLEGLVDHYGFEEGKATQYFTVHAKLDIEHAAHARAQIERLADDADTDRLVARAQAAAHGNWRLLDGVNTKTLD